MCCSRRPEPAREGYDRALAVAGNVRLLTLGQVDPDRFRSTSPANAVVVPSEREGFGLAVLEALACDVPVLATPVGIHPTALAGIEGTYCARSTSRMARRTRPAPRERGSAHPRDVERAGDFSTDRMAAAVVIAWRAALER